MDVTTRTQAILLLAVRLSRSEKGDPGPLSPAEWGRLSAALDARGLSPENLLADDTAKVLADWQDRTVTVDRIRALLDRGAALGLALEKWQRAGLWIMTRADADYPSRLARRLADCPPVLFGCGDRALAERGGIAVVGSRNADEDALDCATRLGQAAARQGCTIVSGGARGVDEAAMLGAIDAGGTAIGILADGLLRAATSGRYRAGLLARTLALASPFNPEAGFDVGSAMVRNRYIYCLADAGIVVATSRDTGGTWHGAVENLRKGWIPLWVRLHGDRASGNAALVEKGARWLPEGDIRIADLIVPATTPANQPVQAEIAFGHEPAALAETEVAPAMTPARASSRSDTWEMFLRRFAELTAAAPVGKDALASAMGVAKSRLDEWLKRAVAEGRARKLARPVRYQAIPPEPEQPSLFGESPIERA